MRIGTDVTRHQTADETAFLTNARAYGIYDREYQVYEKKVRMAKTSTRTSLLMTNAPTNTMMIHRRNRIVATSRTGLNIVLSCRLNPIRKPVPVNEMRIPRVYKSAKPTILPNTNRIDPMIETAKPPTRQPKNP